MVGWETFATKSWQSTCAGTTTTGICGKGCNSSSVWTSRKKYTSSKIKSCLSREDGRIDASRLETYSPWIEDGSWKKTTKTTASSAWG